MSNPASKTIKNVLRSFIYTFLYVPRKLLGIFWKLLYSSPIVIALSYLGMALVFYYYHEPVIHTVFGDGATTSFLLNYREVIFIAGGTLFIFLLSQVNNTLIGAYVSSLDRAQQDYQTTFEKSPVGIAQMHVDEGFRHVNSQLVRMLEYQREELLELKAGDIMNRESLETSRAHERELQQGVRSSYQCEVKLKKKDGSELYALITKSPLYDHDGNIDYMLAVFEDISQLKLSEEELRNSLDTFKKFVPKEFLSYLGKEKYWDVERGDRTEETFTVMFTDIRSYSTMSQQMSDEENFEFISSFIYQVAPVIRENHGFIDKFIGDAIMALFPDEPDNAVRSALALQNKLDQFNASLNQPINVGIGLHTGTLVLGAVGDDERLQTTVLSDHVNIAQRIEELTKTYESSILISENTFNNLADRWGYNFRKLKRINLKGRQGYTNVYALLDDMGDLSGREKDSVSSK